MTTDSDITKIITANVAIAATSTNFLDPRTEPDPTCSRGSPSGVRSSLLSDLLKGCFSSFDRMIQI
ncbi:MAG: hypothetical protein WBQ25_00560 [Nitrososphaeraceae archaeon]